MVSATFSVPLHKLNSSFIDKIKAFIDHEGGEPNLFISVAPKLESTPPGVAWYSVEHDDFEDQMSDEQSNALGEAIKMTYDENNLIPQSEAKKLVAQWLNQKQSNG